MHALFPLGRLVITPAALEVLNSDDIAKSLLLHSLCSWGDLDPEDLQANEEALKNGGRLLSAYTDRNKRRFWIITEADRSVTTILLPEDY